MFMKKYILNPLDEIKIVILTIPYLIMIYYLPAFLADYISYSIGIILFIFGATGFFRVRLYFSKIASEKKEKLTERKKFIISGAISIISVLFWIELFTYNSWLFWEKIDFTLVLIWSMNTFFYSFIFSFIKEF